MPDSYTVPLEDEADGRGVDVIASIAAVMARVAADVETTTQAMYILPHSSQTAPPAAGATQATGALTLTRTPPTAGDINLLEGDPLVVNVLSPDNVESLETNIELDADVTMPSGSKGPVAATVRASRAGYQGKRRGHPGALRRFQRPPRHDGNDGDDEWCRARRDHRYRHR